MVGFCLGLVGSLLLGFLFLVLRIRILVVLRGAILGLIFIFFFGEC